MIFSSDTPALCRYPSQRYLRQSDDLAGSQLFFSRKLADKLFESLVRCSLQAGATLPVWKNSVWQQYFLAALADKTPGLPR